MIKRIRTVCVFALLGVSVAITLPAALLQQPDVATPEAPRALLFQFGAIGDGVADDT